MEVNKHLAIVIPTYNRADFLDYSLEVHIPQCKEHNIQIFISDNASTDNTEEIAKKWMKEYEHLHYSKNETNIGPDANFEKALKLPDTDYVWLLSDTYQIPIGAFEYIEKKIQETKYDLFVFNLVDTLKIESKDYTNANKLLYDLGALMTCAAINVYNKKLIEKANFSRYYNSYFIQTGIIFEYIVNKKFSACWIEQKSIINLNLRNTNKESWYGTSKLFDYGCEKWLNFIFSLPIVYNLSTKMKIASDFAKVTPHYKILNLLKLRLNNELNYEIYNRYSLSIKQIFQYKRFIVIFVSIIPLRLLYSVYYIYKNIKK